MSMDFTASLFASTNVDIVLHLDDSCKGILHSMQKDLLYLPLYNHFSLFSLAFGYAPQGLNVMSNCNQSTFSLHEGGVLAQQ